MYQGEKSNKRRDPLESKREENARRNFKKVLADILDLLRHSTGVETAILYWVNTSRKIFVQESHATICDNIMLQDRVNFEDLYLYDFINLKEPVQLKVGRDIKEEELTHYFQSVPVSWVTLVPFVNNGETVALTVLESARFTDDDDFISAIESFQSSLGNLLQTYLELNGLSDNQTQWVDYEEQLGRFEDRIETIPLLLSAISELQSYLEQGNVALITRGMDNWNVVLNARFGHKPPPVGLPVEEQSVAWQALQEGTPQFVIHFNASPKRISPREPESRGATLAVPVLVEGRRHAVFIITDENPLIFTEAKRHKLINLIRVVALKLASQKDADSVKEDLLVGRHGAYHSELLEATIQQELKRPSGSEVPAAKAGLVTLSDVPGLRARLRLEDLDELQRKLVERLNPQQYGFHGYLAWHSDYVYAFVIQSEAQNPVDGWKQAIKSEFQEPMEIGEEQQLSLDFHIGWVEVNKDFDDPHGVLRSARQELSNSMKEQDGDTVKQG